MRHAPAGLAWLGLAAAVVQAAAPVPWPAWALRAWSELVARQPLQVATRLHPQVLAGDFDGDGRQDLAVLVVAPETRKEGIAFLLQGRPAQVIGAGRAFGNGGSDFAWMDQWHLQPRAAGTPAQRNRQGQVARSGAVDLIVARESSASARIRWHDGQPVWHQRGD